jgi:hypothetical protein
MALAHGAGVPTQLTCQVQPITWLQVACPPMLSQMGAVPVHVEEGMSHEHPWLMQPN